MSGMVRHAIRDSGDEMAEILGPVMGEAIRVQIRDSRDEMIDTLYPIIGATIQKAISEFSREFQRNIDTRLRSTFGPEGMLRRFWARLRGVSAAELALRDAFPFDIKQIFLIHRVSGILVAHSEPGNFSDNNSDLIGAMLTAIRSFATDAFQGADELDEIQFGGDRIIIQNGAHAYLALVLAGTEPEGLHARLSEFVSDLHLRHNSALRDFKGNPQDLPDLQPQLAQLAGDLGAREKKGPVTPQQKRLYFVAGLLGALLVTLVCFYLIFTVNLLPVAFPRPTPTPMPPTATASPAATSTSAPTATLMPTSTATLAPSPTLEVIVPGISTGSVWVHVQPAEGSATINLLPKGVALQIQAMQGGWMYVSWTDAAGHHEGWVVAEWIQPERDIPPQIITPDP
jgi:hypothetical protein